MIDGAKLLSMLYRIEAKGYRAEPKVREFIKEAKDYINQTTNIILAIKPYCYSTKVTVEGEDIDCETAFKIDSAARRCLSVWLSSEQESGFVEKRIGEMDDKNCLREVSETIYAVDQSALTPEVKSFIKRGF